MRLMVLKSGPLDLKGYVTVPGVLLGILGGCMPPVQILTLFQKKKCHFPHPFSDLVSKIHTLKEGHKTQHYMFT